MGLFPGSITRVDTMDAFRAAECTYWRPVYLLPRSLPFAFNAAAEVIGIHGRNFAQTYNNELSLDRLKRLAAHLPELKSAFNSAGLYDGAKNQIDFIITDMTGWADEGIEAALRFVPRGGYCIGELHHFHRDGIGDGTRRICTYTDDTTEGLGHLDAAAKDDGDFNARLWARIQRPQPGDITKHNKWWIHRAPQNAEPRLVLVG